MESRLDRWERRVQLPLTLSSLLFIAAYAWPILEPGLPRERVVLCAVVVWATWMMLVIDLVVRLRLADHRWEFLRRNLADVAMVVLPILRPLQLIRLLLLLKVLNRYAGRSLRGRVGMYLTGSVVLIVLVGALAILDAERGGEGAIQSFGDAVWWALATISTVGYGDMYPVTTVGRFVAAGLIVCGIGVLGVVTATFASWLIERVEDVEEAARGSVATSADMDALRAEIGRLREAIDLTNAQRPSDG